MQFSNKMLYIPQKNLNALDTIMYPIIAMSSKKKCLI